MNILQWSDCGARTDQAADVLKVEDSSSLVQQSFYPINFTYGEESEVHTIDL